MEAFLYQWHQGWASECPDVKNYKLLLNLVLHKMLYSCTHMAAVGVRGLTIHDTSKHNVCLCLSACSDLNGNRLQRVKGLTFQGLSSVVSLRLRRNLLTDLMDGAFYGLSNVQTMYVTWQTRNTSNNDGHLSTSSWQSHCESSLGSCYECRLSTKQPCKPSYQSNWLGLWVHL